MTWLKFGDEWIDAPTVTSLTDGAVLLHISALSYCTRFDTDGVLPAGALRGLRCGSRPNAQRLVACGLWEPRHSGWLMTDYEQHCRTTEMKRVEAERVAQYRRTRAS